MKGLRALADSLVLDSGPERSFLTADYSLPVEWLIVKERRGLLLLDKMTPWEPRD